MKTIAQAVREMQDAKFNDEWKQMLLGKLNAEHAIDLSDAELERCFDGVCKEEWCVRTSCMYRDCGFMTVEELSPSRFEDGDGVANGLYDYYKKLSDENKSRPRKFVGMQ